MEGRGAIRTGGGGGGYGRGGRWRKDGGGGGGTFIFVSSEVVGFTCISSSSAKASGVDLGNLTTELEGEEKKICRFWVGCKAPSPSPPPNPLPSHPPAPLPPSPCLKTFSGSVKDSD